jgi:hypothetical protein
MTRFFEELSSDEHDEIGLITQRLATRREQAVVRRLLLQHSDDRVRVTGRVLLCAADQQRELLGQAAALEDEEAILLHCAIDDPVVLARRAAIDEQRVVVLARLRSASADLDIVVGRPPQGGPAWSRRDLSAAFVDEAERTTALLREDIVRVVGLLVDSGLLRVVHDPATFKTGINVFAPVDQEPASLARISASIAEIERIGQMAQQVTERMELEALRSLDGTRLARAGEAVSRRRALDELDAVRALHDALAEVRAITAP